jgi:hypothetical protein
MPSLPPALLIQIFAGTKRQQQQLGGQPPDLDRVIAQTNANPNLSEEEKQRHVAFPTRLAEQHATAAARGKPVPAPWPQPKLGAGGARARAAAGAGGGGQAGGKGGDGGGEDPLAAFVGGADALVGPGRGVKSEPGAAVPVKPEPGPAAAAAAGGEAAGEEAARAKRRWLELEGQFSAGDFDLLVGKVEGAPMSGGEAAEEQPPQQQPQPQPPPQQQNEQPHHEDGEEEWEDLCRDRASSLVACVGGAPPLHSEAPALGLGQVLPQLPCNPLRCTVQY